MLAVSLQAGQSIYLHKQVKDVMNLSLSYTALPMLGLSERPPQLKGQREVPQSA